MGLNATVAKLTDRIKRRSCGTRDAYLSKIAAMRRDGRQRGRLGCTNLAHGFAAAAGDKPALAGLQVPNIGIVSAYNDMLSAHQPLGAYPALIRAAAREVGATAQFAGGVPAMCDGVTQGQPGMELSLFSRDVIAQSTAIALSHDMFDAVLCLGVCDKIVPGLLIGALAYGHLPCIFVPGGPMPSGLPNDEKARTRQLYAQGKIDRAALLEAESRSYHSAGTCTFYGTANSNQMMMEVMGLHLPGAAFVNPGTPLRDALTAAAARQVAGLVDQPARALGELVTAEAIVNAMVGLLATGGSTNHTLHIVAMGRAAGLVVNWDDFDVLSGVTPALTRIYPNGSADVNHFHAAGGMGFLIRELLEAGLLHDIPTVAGGHLRDHAREPFLNADGDVEWRDAPADSGDDTVLRPAARPFAPSGGLRVLSGRLGRAVIKVSAVDPDRHRIEAPARVFDSQAALQAAFQAGELTEDFVAVVRGQGPAANGMPELHKLTPPVGVLQDQGLRVALVTDGRMSGASGKVPAAIHVTPEAADGGPLAKVRDGDRVVVDATTGTLDVLVDDATWAAREPASVASDQAQGFGRELFGGLRRQVSGAEQGACTLFDPLPAEDAA